MVKKVKPFAHMGKLKKAAKERGTSLRKIAMVADIPVKSLYNFDKRINNLGQEAAIKVMRCLRLSEQEWFALTGEMMKLSDWQPSAKQWDLLYRDQRTRK